MWKYNNTIIRAGKAWTDSAGIQHPYNWMVWDDATKANKGLVWEDDPAPFDNKFYWSANVARELADTLWVDDDGNAVVDEMTGEQGVTLGLKSQYKAQTKVTANGLLAGTDWMVIRLQEDSSKTLSTAVANYRAAVRTASGTIETAIDNASDIDAFKALFDTPMKDNEPTGKAPINNWPDEL
tara:strand:- start:10 stop:555 length:546 start_codon:yes stop_codon:yes gene_type:complete